MDRTMEHLLGFAWMSVTVFAIMFTARYLWILLS